MLDSLKRTLSFLLRVFCLKNNYKALFLESWKSFLSLIRKHYKVLALILFSFLALSFSLSFYDSREIDRISLKVNKAAGEEIGLIPLAKLSGSSVMERLRQVKGSPGEWLIDKYPVDKIFIGFDKKSLVGVDNLEVIIGEKSHSFDKEAIALWPEASKGIKDYYSVVYGEEKSILVLEAPIVGEKGSLNLSRSSALDRSLAYFFKLLAVCFALFIYLFLTRFFFKDFFSPKGNLETNEAAEKDNFLLFSLTLIFSSLFLIILNIVLAYFYHSETLNQLIAAKEIYLDRLLPRFYPKPLERMQFILSVLLSPFIAVVGLVIFRKLLSKLSGLKMDLFYRLLFFSSFISLLFFIFFSLANSGYYFLRSSILFYSPWNLVYLVFFYPLLLAFLLYNKKHEWKKFYLFLLYGSLFSAVIYVFFINLSSLNNVYDPYHFNPIFYPSSQLIFGKTLLVDFNSFYGLFPAFLNPIFKVIGLSVLSFSAVMAVIFCICYALIFFFLKKNIKNNLIFLTGFLSIFSWLAWLRFWPIRLIFPFLMIFISSYYFRKKSDFLYYFSFIIFGIGLLWNLEVGLVVFFSWLLTLIYDDLHLKDWRVVIKKIGRHIITGIGSLILVFGSFTLVSYWGSGKLIDWLNLLKYQGLVLSGYFMVPMPSLPHFWGLVILVYLSGLVYALKLLLERRQTLKGTIIFLLSVFGVGLFGYYESIPHDVRLIAPAFPVLLILIIYADELWDYLKQKGLGFNPGSLVFIIITIFLFSAPLSLLAFLPSKAKELKNNIVSTFSSVDSLVSRNVDFIKSHTKKGEAVLIFAESFDGVYYTESKTKSALPLPSSTDYFFKAEIKMLVDFLNNNKTTKIFIYPADYVTSDKEVGEVLSNKYRVLEISLDGMALLGRKE